MFARCAYLEHLRTEAENVEDVEDGGRGMLGTGLVYGCVG